MYFVTTEDSNGNVLAWVEGTKFVSLFNVSMKPFSTAFEAEAHKKLENEVSRYVTMSGLSVRRAVIDVRWKSCEE